MRYHYKQYKSILSAKNGMNLYRGCTHGCIYCDSRSKCYNMDHDFEDIEVKADSDKMLMHELMHKRKPCMIGSGSMCDPYLPLEKELCATRKSLEIIDRFSFGATVLTKSDLVLRDLDLLKSINSKTKCVVQMTMTTFDEKLCSILEPGVCTTKRRFETLMILKEANIPTVVWLCPILPFINDTEENLRGILDYCFEAGVKGIINFGFGVTLREGDREYFYSALDRHFPGMKEQYIRSFGNAYECSSKNNAYLMRIFRSECQKHSVMHNANEVFAYLNSLEEQKSQLSLFDM